MSRIETSIVQLASGLNTKDKGTLPSQTQPNLKDQAERSHRDQANAVIILRSRKTVDNKVRMPEDESHESPNPSTEKAVEGDKPICHMELSYKICANTGMYSSNDELLENDVELSNTRVPHGELQKFYDELKNRSRVLKKLGHIDANCIVQLKGRAGTFNDLDHHQVAALASCFIPGEKSNEQIHFRTELGKPLQQLQRSARRIAEIQRECNLEVNVEEYVKSTVKLFFMYVIYCWSKVATFAEVIEMTDIFEGSII
ncbi:hypothetical protein GIB67_029706 [Kingdonia uniflora]|uniref:ATP-dependent RNA helicase Ski2/MTR4 C-terminal domain-containing protein n=1 Tax=Kingdonia uniflora TaxID=39325 RepID=A0A7J7LLK8_9MAGN|nr:hypothetical protein GIB67_029706 [Kingdonia uniflora]